MSRFNRIHTSIVCSALLISSAHALNSFPRGCEVTGFAYSQNYLILNDTGKQAYYLIQNHSDSRIELEHQASEEAFMSPPLHATLDSMNWGAFASDIKNLNFRCYKHIGEGTSPVDCRDVLDVCQYPRARFALSNMGNYWVSFNKSQSGIIQESVAKGIYLKW
ncbi:MAG: enhanced entry protein EnhB [Legionella sp.]|uniref:enhanced entry protein EnhB n=1 Tax=Legionella sp. TaxID=459 RepID=UPI0039E59D38